MMHITEQIIILIISPVHIDGLMQKRHDSSALAMELIFLARSHRYQVSYAWTAKRISNIP